MGEKQDSKSSFSQLCQCFKGKSSKKHKPLSSTDGFSISHDSTQSSVSTSTVPNDGAAVVFTMAELSKATSNFSPSCRIGQGGFGVVYKGRLANGRLVAIKRARKDLFEARLTSQFQNELNTLAKVEHLNLVKFIGYLEEGDERCVVEEFVPNGNLRQHLDCEFDSVLDLYARVDIAIDISHALTYLHVYAEEPIIHRDVKASNILLTDSRRAKVADFGFSRLGSNDSGATHVVTQVKGTAGYLDPEYLRTYQLSPKSDVYSFGVLMIELLTGRRPIEYDRKIDERITLRWAYGKFQKGEVEEIVDPKLNVPQDALFVVEKMFEVAFQCVAPTKQERPAMRKVSEYLWVVRKDCQTLAQEQSVNGGSGGGF